MGWAIGYDRQWKRDIGYGVPAFCDFPTCGVEIDRGLAYVCAEQQMYGGDRGCGLYFCEKHRFGDMYGRCSRCRNYRSPFTAKPDHPLWIQHKLTDESWAEWRAEHPVETLELARATDAVDPQASSTGTLSTREK